MISKTSLLLAGAALAALATAASAQNVQYRPLTVGHGRYAPATPPRRPPTTPTMARPAS